jgi:hypothetical protein
LAGEVLAPPVTWLTTGETTLAEGTATLGLAGVVIPTGEELAPLGGFEIEAPEGAAPVD